jgi:hypothetical protein
VRWRFLKARNEPAGRFRITALSPGYLYSLSDRTGSIRLDGSFRSGETKDLGDVQMKAP